VGVLVGSRVYKVITTIVKEQSNGILFTGFLPFGR